MVQFYRQLLYIRGKSLSHKNKQPLFHLGILRNVNTFYKIVDIFQTLLIFFSTKKWEIMFSWVWNFIPFYSILIYLFLQLTGRANWGWKGVGGGWEEAALCTNTYFLVHWGTRCSSNGRLLLGAATGRLIKYYRTKYYCQKNAKDWIKYYQF
jgi:hypothetical protein